MQTIIRFFKTIFLVDLLKGLWVTLSYTPSRRSRFGTRRSGPTAPRFRGVLRLQTEPGTGAQTCIVCDQCAKACPDDLIALGGHREPGQKIKVLDYFDFNLSRCSFCGLCSEVCPTKPIKALIMSEDYELGTYSRESQVLRVDQMYDGVQIEQHNLPIRVTAGRHQVRGSARPPSPHHC
jgi:NADH-quinone oxidoreductase subunit I